MPVKHSKNCTYAQYMSQVDVKGSLTRLIVLTDFRFSDCSKTVPVN